MIPLMKRESRSPQIQSHVHQHLRTSRPSALLTPSRAPCVRRAESADLSMNASTPHCALVVTQQPPQKWYKDQFGRKATFDIQLQRVGQCCVSCVDQRHLAVQLLYENGYVCPLLLLFVCDEECCLRASIVCTTSKPVENQSILRITSGLCLNKDNQSTIAIRIMEVSKNHQNQVSAG